MAAIRGGGVTRQLEPEHTVGRNPGCVLYINLKYISGQHAMFRFVGERWELMDSGSRNGTTVDGAPLKPGEWVSIRAGSKITFGKAEQEWEVIDDSPPVAMAVPLDGGDPAIIDNELLTLPSNENPRATIYRALDGSWTLEQADSIAPIASHQVFEFEGRSYRFSCPEPVYKTSLVDNLPPEMREVELRFLVSKDEEHVQLYAAWSSHVIDLGDRSHNYLLLTLARRRVKDAAEGLSDTSCGWVYQEDFSHDPSMAPAQLNIDVFRVRKHLAAHGIADAAHIIERRPRNKQLRLGTGRISITTE